MTLAEGRGHVAQLHHWGSKLRSGSGGIWSREMFGDQIPKGLGKGFGLALEETAGLTWSDMNFQGGIFPFSKEGTWQPRCTPGMDQSKRPQRLRGLPRHYHICTGGGEKA